MNLPIIIYQYMKTYKYNMGSLITKILAHSQVKIKDKKGRHGVIICTLNFLEVNKEVKWPPTHFKLTKKLKGPASESEEEDEFEDEEDNSQLRSEDTDQKYLEEFQNMKSERIVRRHHKREVLRMKNSNPFFHIRECSYSKPHPRTSYISWNSTPNTKILIYY